MATRIGRIVRWGRMGRTFVEAYLDTGVKVELPYELAGVAQQLADERLVFVERRGRLFHYVQWIGTARQARDAYEAGVLKRGEFTEEVLLQSIAESPAGHRIAAAAMRGLANEHAAEHEADAHRPTAEEIERGRDVLTWAQHMLPARSAVGLNELACLMKQTLVLGHHQLSAIEEASNDVPFTVSMDAVARLSDDSLKVGFAVRAVRWPAPIGDREAAEFRLSLPRAALVIEQAVAALVEPGLTEDQRRILYAPLEPVVPRASLAAPR